MILCLCFSVTMQTVDYIHVLTKMLNKIGYIPKHSVFSTIVSLINISINKMTFFFI